MSKKDKLLLKLRNNPTNVKFETLRTILLSYGFSERQPRGGSSHYTYTLDEFIITVPKKKPLKAIYVKNVLRIIDEIDNN